MSSQQKVVAQKNKMTSNKKLGIGLNLLSVIIMSFSPLLNKFALKHMDATMAAILNTAFATGLCYLYARVRQLPFPSPKKHKSLWLIGLTNSAGIICQYLSLQLLSPVMIGILGRFYIIFAIILSAAFLKEPISKEKLVLISTAILGMFLFVTKGFGFENMIGILFALLYTFLFALTNMIVKLTIRNVEANSILFYNNAISLLFLIGYFLIIGAGERNLLEFRIDGVILVFISALLSGFIGLLLFYNGLRHIEFSTANLIRSTSPVWIVIISWSFFPIDLTWLNVLGAVILLGSIITLATAKKA